MEAVAFEGSPEPFTKDRDGWGEPTKVEGSAQTRVWRRRGGDVSREQRGALTTGNTRHRSGTHGK